MKSEAEWKADHEKLQAIMRANRRNEKYYLFLDFDGVINVFYLEGTPEYEEVSKRASFDFSDHHCVGRLDRLCHDYPLHIVISSSWRFSGPQYCEDYLRLGGLSEDIHVEDVTNIVSMQPREEDITEYLFAHPDFSGFLILDDMNMPHLADYHVKTNPLQGYTEERDALARKIIQNFM